MKILVDIRSYDSSGIENDDMETMRRLQQCIDNYGFFKCKGMVTA